MRSNFLAIVFAIVCDLFIVADVLTLEELIQVHSLLDHVRDFFETLEGSVWVVQDQLLEHFLEVSVERLA